MSGAAGGAAIGHVEVDSRNIDLALAHHDPPAAIRTVCALLTNDAQTAIGNLPTPDTQLTDDLNTAYEDAAAAGNDCYNGAAGNAALLRRSAAERRQAALPLLATAVDRIDVDHRAHAVHLDHAPAPSDAGGDPFGELSRPGAPGMPVRRRRRTVPRRAATPTSTTGSGAGCSGRCPPGCSSSGAGPASGAT